MHDGLRSEVTKDQTVQMSNEYVASDAKEWLGMFFHCHAGHNPTPKLPGFDTPHSFGNHLWGFSICEERLPP